MITTTATQTTTSLEQFYQELLNDPILQERLKAATDPESLCELAVELGKEKGFSFTKEEALAAMAIESAMGGENLAENLTGLSVVADGCCGSSSCIGGSCGGVY